MTRRIVSLEDASADARDLDPVMHLDEALDSLITLVGATSSPDTHRVLARHLLGAFDDLAAAGRFPAGTSEPDQPANRHDFFNALYELIDLGFVSLSFQGYGLTELGEQRAAATADSTLDDVAGQWRI